MKKQLLLLLAFCVSGVIFGQTVPELIYYKFDGTGTSVPNQASSPPAGTATGTIVGSGMTQGGAGLCGGALIGPGSASANVNTGWNTALGTGAWTIMFWTDNIPNTTTLYYQWGDAGASGFRVFNNGVAGPGNWWLRGPVTDVPCNGCAPVGPGNPSFTAFVYDPVAGNITSYHNGVLNTVVAQGALNINGSDFRVGHTSGTGMGPGQLMDEFRVYNRALTATEIAAVSTGCYPFVQVPNEAGTQSIDSPAAFCAGQNNIVATIKNHGINQIDTVTANWSINGVVQTPTLWTNLLDTVGGTGPNTAQITLGSHVFTAGKVDTITVWTSMPNNVADTVNGNDTVTSYLQPALSGFFTIGGPGANYPDFTSAVADLNTFGICGPVAFNVYDSVYTEQISIGAINGSSAVNTISFGGATDTTKITFGATLSNANYTVRLDGCDWVDFDNLIIESSGVTYGRAVEIQSGSEWCTIKNCKVQYAGTGNTTSTNKALIYSPNANDDYFTLENCTVDGGSYGLYMRGTSTTSLEKGLTIKDNDFINQYYFGMDLWYHDSTTVDFNNLNYTSTYTGTSYGIRAYYQDNNFFVTNNKIIGDTVNQGSAQWRYMLYLVNCDGTSSKRQLIANNMIANADTVYTGTVYGIYSSNNGYQDIIHNSVCISNSSTNSRALYGTGGGGSSLNNNILTNLGTGYAIYLNSGFTYTSVDYNNLYAPNGNVGYFSGAQATMANWQTASGFDANSFNVDPLFYSKWDLHTCADTLESAGTPTGLVSADIDVEARGATPDIGADEFATLAGNFLGPDTAICPGDTVMIGVPGLNGTFAWSTGDSTNTINVTAAQTYILTATSACGAGSDNIIVTHLPLPVASFTQFVSFYTVQFTSTSTNATSWWWDFGDGNTSTQQNPLHVYAWPGGTFTVTHVAYNNCGNDTTVIVVTADESTGITESAFAAGVSIYPNPATDDFNINLNLDQSQEATIEILDVTGAVVYNRTLVGKQGANTVKVEAEYASGAYFVRIKSDKNIAIKKLIIE